jgi:hypothetical protein
MLRGEKQGSAMQKVIFRLLFSALLAIYCLSSLSDTFDQDNLFPVMTLQISGPASDNDTSLDKRKKFLAAGQIDFVSEIGQAKEALFLFKESFPSLRFNFPYFLRAPPSV